MDVGGERPAQRQAVGAGLLLANAPSRAIERCRAAQPAIRSGQTMPRIGDNGAVLVPVWFWRRLALLALPRWGDTVRRCVARLLRVQIGVYEDEVVWRCRPEQLRALSCLAHPGHSQFEQRARA